MKICKKYSILSANRHYKIKSGKTVIKLNLNECYIYLPVRFNILPEYFLDEINNNTGYQIENCGRWKKTFQLIFSNSSNGSITNQLNQDILDFCFYNSVEPNNE